VVTKINCGEPETTRFGWSDEVRKQRAMPKVATNVGYGQRCRNVECGSSDEDGLGRVGLDAEAHLVGRDEAMARIGGHQQVWSQTKHPVRTGPGEQAAMRVSSGERTPPRAQSAVGDTREHTRTSQIRRIEFLDYVEYE
jgi:hypothetical protein